MAAQTTGEPIVLSMEDAVARARAHVADGRRFVLGLAGPPGGGKSTLSDALARELGDGARVVGMDGFHLAQEELRRLGREDRKGAPDTFDATGYVALLRRLRDPAEEVVYAPRFRRDLEEPIGSAIPVPREVALVVTEGNYLLLDDGPWAPVRGLLDAAWYVATPDAVRVERLIARHVAHGRSPEAAREWVLRSDERNAELVAATRGRADAVVRVD
jgi:pantothenate kinase